MERFLERCRGALAGFRVDAIAPRHVLAVLVVAAIAAVALQLLAQAAILALYVVGIAAILWGGIWIAAKTGKKAAEDAEGRQKE